jgi:hypothetical protein
VRHHRLLAVAATAAALALITPLHADASGAKGPHPRLSELSTDVFAPFNTFVDATGIYIADGGANVVSRLSFDGSTQTPLVTDAPGVSGVAKKHKRLAYTTTVTNEETFENTASALNIKSPTGTLRADTLAYENAHNPDQVNTYGFAHPTPCQVEGLGPQAQYTGQIDSHAYSVAAWGNKWIVADAGANDLLLVDNSGHISTLAVLPPQPAVITAEFAEANDLDPSCFAGSSYGFEPVPTDIEVGNNGMLYITTLPGGPEGPELGARGSLWRLNPESGKLKRLATGFAGATNLAIGKHGRIYVTELFAGKISVVRTGHVSHFVDLPGVVSIERGLRPGRLYAGTLDPTFSGPGSIVRIKYYGGPMTRVM